MRLELRKFSTTIFKDKSTSDAAQIPAAATVSVYRQGATVNGPVVVTNTALGVLTTVFSVGRLVDGDTVQVGTDSSRTMTVIATSGFPTNTQLYLKRTSGSNISLVTGDRLVPTSPLPTIYSDCEATNSLGASTTSSSVSGGVEFYTPEARFDYIISGSGLTSQLVTDAEGGWSRGGVPWINARDFKDASGTTTAGIQEAINALPDDDGTTAAPGGVVYLPAGAYNVTTTITLTDAKVIKLLGDGVAATTIISSSTTNDIIRIQGTFSGIENLCVKGPGSTGAGRGVVVGSPTVDGQGYYINDCRIEYSAAQALYVCGTDDVTAPYAGHFNIISFFNRSMFRYNSTAGGTNVCVYLGKGCTTLYFQDCSIQNWLTGGVLVDTCFGVTFERCDIEGAAANATVPLLISSSRNTHVLECWFENPGGGIVDDYAVYLNNGQNDGTVVANCTFQLFGSANPKLVKIGGNAGIDNGVLVINPVVYVDTNGALGSAHIDIGANCLRTTIIGGSLYQQDLTKTDIRITDASNLAMVFGTNRRFRHAGHTSATRNAAAFADKAAGDVIYNLTTGAVELWDGGAWRRGGVPRMTTAVRDAGTETWTDGDVIYNTTTSKFNFRVGAAWSVYP